MDPIGSSSPAHRLTGAPAHRSPPLGESWRAWAALFIGVLAISAQSASSVTYSVLMKPILAEFDWQRTQFASATALRMLVMVVMSPIAGLLTDRIGPRAVLVGGALIIGGGNLAMSRVQSLGELFSFMACMGPGQAGIGAVAASALVLRLFRHRRGLAIGLLNGGDNLISAAVPIGAAFGLQHWGWRPSVVALGAAYVLLAAFIAWTLRAQEKPGATRVEGAARARGGSGLSELPWRDPRLWTLLVAYAGIYAFITSVQLHLHAFQTDLGRTPDEASRILSTLILVGAVGAPLFGWLAERTSAEGALAVVAGGLALTSVALWTVQSSAAFFAWAILYGLVNGGVVALLALVLADLFGGHLIGRLMGVAMVFCMGSTMLANLYTAAMFDRFGSYVPVWQSYTALMVVTLIPVVFLWRRASPGAKNAG